MNSLHYLKSCLHNIPRSMKNNLFIHSSFDKHLLIPGFWPVTSGTLHSVVWKSSWCLWVLTLRPLPCVCPTMLSVWSVWIKISNLSLPCFSEFSVLASGSVGLNCQAHTHSRSRSSLSIIPFVGIHCPLSCPLMFYTLNSTSWCVSVTSMFLCFTPFRTPLRSATRLLAGSRGALTLERQPPRRKAAAVIWPGQEHELSVTGGSRPGHAAELAHTCSLGWQLATLHGRPLVTTSQRSPSQIQTHKTGSVIKTFFFL